MKNNYLLHAGISSLLIFCISCGDIDQKTNIADSDAVSEGEMLQKRAKSGEQQLEDGSTYQGELMKGEPHGYGKRNSKMVISLKVSFKRGGHTGMVPTGLKKDELLDRYVGMWSNDTWNGYGTLVLNDGSRVTGHWKKDRLEYGDYEGSDGTIRSGKWRGNWEFLEEGFSRDAFGSEYNGKFNGDGSYRSGFIQNPNGDLYAGDFLANAYHGKGILEREDGTLYVGDFEDNQFTGNGMLINSDGSKYTGQFSEGLPEGYGVEEQANGVRYFGSWSNGVKEGAGTVDFGNGATYVGDFRNGFAYEGKYDWGDGRVTDSYQDEFGNWLDR